MTLAAWTFQLFQPAAFVVLVDVKNLSTAEVFLTRVSLQRTGGAVSGWVKQEIDAKILKNSGVHRFTLTDADTNPDTFFVAGCIAHRPNNAADRWSWTLGVEQNGALCGLVPGQIDITGQRFGPQGVRDPGDGDHSFAGRNFSDSTIAFDVMPPKVMS